MRSLIRKRGLQDRRFRKSNGTSSFNVCIEEKNNEIYFLVYIGLQQLLSFVCIILVILFANCMFL